MRKTYITLAATALAAFMPIIAFAQVANFCDIVGIVNTAAVWFGIIVFILGVVAILYAAFLFFTAGGDEEKIKTARTVLIYGVIGIAVALLATNAKTIISATTGGNSSVFSTCNPAPNKTFLGTQ